MNNLFLVMLFVVSFFQTVLFCEKTNKFICPVENGVSVVSEYDNVLIGEPSKEFVFECRRGDSLIAISDFLLISKIEENDNEILIFSSSDFVFVYSGDIDSKMITVTDTLNKGERFGVVTQDGKLKLSILKDENQIDNITFECGI